MAEKRKLNSRFRFNCWLSVILIFLSMAGMLLPTVLGEGIQIFALLLLALSVFALVHTVLFYLMVAHIKSVMIVSKK